MSAFYDQASLVVVPSGYKSGKIYAQKPLTTDGQLTFTRASTATRVNASGLIETVASGVPRLDYLGSTCPKLLLEPQRSNLALQSEQMDNAAWTKTGVTISANASVSPDGYTSADKIVGAASAGDKLAFQSLTITTGQAFTISAFFKKSEYKLAFIRAGGQTGQPYVIYDLDTEAVVSTSGASSTKIEDYGNGWYRVSLTLNSASGTSVATVVSFLPNTGYTLSALNVPSYTGDGTSGGFVWGCQLEANGAAYATSYIPTLSTSVTRVGDVAEKTGISSLIGQTEGVLFVDFQINSFDQLAKWIAFLGGGSTYVGIFTTTTNFFNLEVFNVSTQAINTTTGFVVGQRYKIAIAYKANDFAFYVNGLQVGTDNSGTVPTMSEFKLQYNTSANNLTARTYNQALVFKTRLTNAQLAELTTL
jgi:hypothetical protein